MTRRHFLKTSAVGAAALAAGAQAAPRKRKPNILYIMSDEQR
jgi:anaerobic selenocysteine-containing dehydrogenase